jgi:hypothetical protein
VWIYACYFDLLCRDLSITKFFGRFQQLVEKYSVIRLHMTRDDIDNFMLVQEKIEDTTGVIRIRKSKDKHNGQRKKDTWTNNDLQNIHIKLKIEQHESH